MAEINAFTKDESAKHRKCYQIVKYILKKANNRLVDMFGIQNYDVKTVSLHHTITCSNSTDDCFECVMEIFEELLSAYESEKMENYNESNINILSQHRFCDETKLYCQRLIEILRSQANADTLEMFIERVAEIKFPFNKPKKEWKKHRLN